MSRKVPASTCTKANSSANGYPKTLIFLKKWAYECLKYRIRLAAAPLGEMEAKHREISHVSLDRSRSISTFHPETILYEPYIRISIRSSLDVCTTEDLPSLDCAWHGICFPSTFTTGEQALAARCDTKCSCLMFNFGSVSEKFGPSLNSEAIYEVDLFWRSGRWSSESR